MINPGVLADMAQKLDGLGLNYAFVGGSIVEFLLDNQGLSPVRPTDDLDIIVEVLANRRYSDIEQTLRGAGFQHDTTQGAPICRWLHNGIKIDVMPTDGGVIGINTAWFSEALSTAQARIVLGVKIPLISPVAFIATKLAAFTDRGRGDYYGSHDLEDIITVIDGRAAMVEEVAASPTALRAFIAGRMREFVADDFFQESLSGHLPPDNANQRRLPALRTKLKRIAEL
jgi:predicted nucleotidyltransferase